MFIELDSYEGLRKTTRPVTINAAHVVMVVEDETDRKRCKLVLTDSRVIVADHSYTYVSRKFMDDIAVSGAAIDTSEIIGG